MPAVSPIIDKNTGRAVALVVVTSDGRQLIATVDAQRPSRLLMKDGEGHVYALQVRDRGGDLHCAVADGVLKCSALWLSWPAGSWQAGRAVVHS